MHDEGGQEQQREPQTVHMLNGAYRQGLLPSPGRMMHLKRAWSTCKRPWISPFSFLLILVSLCVCTICAFISLRLCVCMCVRARACACACMPSCKYTFRQMLSSEHDISYKSWCSYASDIMNVPKSVRCKHAPTIKPWGRFLRLMQMAVPISEVEAHKVLTSVLSSGAMGG